MSYECYRYRAKIWLCICFYISFPQRGGQRARCVTPLLASMKGSMCSMSAWVLLMMNWFTQAMAWDLQHSNRHLRSTRTFYQRARTMNSAPVFSSPPLTRIWPPNVRQSFLLSWLCCITATTMCPLNTPDVPPKLHQINYTGNTYAMLTEFMNTLNCNALRCYKPTITNALVGLVGRNTFAAAWWKFCFIVNNNWRFGNEASYLILGLLCLKNCRNLGIMMFRGRSSTSLSRTSAESSQIFCRAPNAPWGSRTKRGGEKQQERALWNVHCCCRRWVWRRNGVSFCSFFFASILYQCSIIMRLNKYWRFRGSYSHRARAQKCLLSSLIHDLQRVLSLLL